jgi:hypothetical protein
MGIGEMRQGERFSGGALLVADWNAFLRRINTLGIYRYFRHFHRPPTDLV